ncbi:protein PIR [Cucumis melo var. makuwa]|uniref:Protein PIR n=1 Tax=Cucumis melo var. makuwa TaxID=1194695 RepID=A0A5D3CFH0_CUCMM|nr:protein PIR [Cucumis melo var. makuwa]
MRKVLWKEKFVEVLFVLWTSSPFICDGLNWKALSLQDSSLLEALFTKKEIREIVFEMGCLKSSGLDAMTEEFYKKPWNVLKPDLVRATDEWSLKVRKGVLLKLDLEKAYDKVDWSLLDMAMKLKGFGLEEIFLLKGAFVREDGNLGTWWKVIDIFLVGAGLSLNSSKTSLIGINLNSDNLAPYANSLAKNTALLTKWLWRFSKEEASLWRRLIVAIYGLEENGWSTKDPNREEKFSNLFSLTLNKDAFVADCWCNITHLWNLGLRRNVLDNELDNVASILEILHSWAPSNGGDSLKWTRIVNGSFTKKSTFLNLTKRSPSIAVPLIRHIWKTKIPKKLLLLKSTENPDIEWCKDVKGNMYDMVVEGFQLLSRWTARIWEQCAWKFSRPCKDVISFESHETSSFSDYEKVVRHNYSAEERKALVELVSYIKSIGSMMQQCDTLVADALWETVHAEVQDFVQNTLATMLRTTFRKKKEISRILSDMRTLSADWMANRSKSDSEAQSQRGEESKVNFFYPRPVAPTATQVHCLQFLIYEVVSGGNLRKPGGLFGNNASEIPISDLKLLENFFYKLSFFLHIFDYTATVATLTDLGFLWFREFYLETSRVIQFPIECSLPWMLVDYVLESQNAGLFESVLFPLDIYNDSAQHALVTLKQRFLYDEIEAEVDHCFDIFVSKLCDSIFTHYKSWAARELLDSSFLFAIDNGEKYSVQAMRFNALLKITRVKLLGRSIDLRSLVAQRMNKIFRENLEFLFDRFESQDLCSIVELEKLMDVLKVTHELLSKDLLIDSFSLMLNEMQENLSLVSFSSRLASQIWSEMQNDFLPNFILCNTTQRFVRSSKVPSVPVQKPSVPHAKPSFYYGTQDLNSAHQSFARLHSGFFGMTHMLSIARLLGSRSLPWLIRALLDHISNKIAILEPMIAGLQEALPRSIGLLPFDGGVAGCIRLINESLNWEAKSELRLEVLHGIKEIGSVLYLISLLDIVLRELDITHFMQTAPWLGIIPGADGQILHSQDGDSPIVSLFKSAASAVVSNPGNPNGMSYYTMSKQAEAADLLYKSNLNTGCVLEYALAFTSAALDKYCSKWSAAPKTGFIDITTSKDFYRIYSGLQIGYLEESAQTPSNNHELLGDSVAWGGCTIVYLLGQQLHFELFDFSYQLLNIAEAEDGTVVQAHKSSQYMQGWESLIEAMKKARRLNNHVFSMLKARCPLEDKTACAIKQSGAPLHRVKFENTVSAFETLPQKGAVN